MLKGFLTLFFIAGTALLYAGNSAASVSSRQSGQLWQENNCVSCHSRISEPVTLSNRYFEWHTSMHAERGVGCEKCHGGDATTKDKTQAHKGILPRTSLQSRLHWQNLPETCDACHQDVVRAFKTSRHYQFLRGTALGPSCVACHEHMASQVAQTPTQAAVLCSRCHATIDGPLPMRLEIPDQAAIFMQALNRANIVVAWADSLYKTAEARRLELSVERMELTRAREALRDMKISWHAFDLDNSRKKADEAFNAGVRARDQLQKKLGY